MLLALADPAGSCGSRAADLKASSGVVGGINGGILITDSERVGYLRLLYRQTGRYAMSATPTVARPGAIDWVSKAQDLDARGWAMLPQLITRDQCRQMSALYPCDTVFRSRVVLSRHGFGRGEYQYFAYPLPELVQSLRTYLYPDLVPIANAWHERMGLDVRFPPTHAD